MNIFKTKNKNLRNSGMTLFIAITIMGILLFVSFAVVNITIKSTLFAASGRDSQVAFYAADAGLECALYWDSVPALSKFDPVIAGGSINCGGGTLTAGSGISGTTTQVTVIGGGGSGSTAYTPVVLVNAGGGAWGPDSQGLSWSANSGSSGGNSYSVGNQIDNTTDDTLYQSEMWNSSDLVYSFSGITNGATLVTLKFAEIYFTSAGQRVFNIEINGTVVESNFDVFTAAGGAFKAIDKQYNVNVTNGNVTIRLIPIVSNPKISAIRIDSQSGGGGGGSTVDTIWVEDSLPAGAISQQDPFNWQGSNPAPFSGSLANKSRDINTDGNNQQYFTGATTPFSIATGEKMLAYVYLDPTDTPTQMMLQWDEGGGSWGHRAYWGTQGDPCIPWGSEGTASKRYIGPMPAAGQWIRLEVPADLVGLENVSIRSMAFTLCNGKATWDKAGKTAAIAGGGGGGSTNTTSTFGFTLNQGENPTNACAIVTVTKNPDGTTYIKSRGYNTCDTSNPRRIERGVEVTY